MFLAPLSLDKDLELFNIVITQRYDNVSASYIMGLISISQFLFDSNQGESAWHYLLKAEELAMNNEQYDLLDNIYNAQMANANHPSAPHITVIIENWSKNKSLADQDERANVASMIVKYNLEKKITENSGLDINAEIEKVLDQYQLDDVMYSRPKLLFNFLSIVRTAVLASKDYVSFAPVIIDIYTESMRKELFKKKDHFYHLPIFLAYQLSECSNWFRHFNASE